MPAPLPVLPGHETEGFFKSLMITDSNNEFALKEVCPTYKCTTAALWVAVLSAVIIQQVTYASFPIGFVFEGIRNGY